MQSNMKQTQQLLAELRIQVEPILKEGAEHFEMMMPQCPSQGHRAIRLLECIDAMGSSVDMKTRHHWWRNASVLRDFLSVRRTVLLLENKEKRKACAEMGIPILY